MTTATVIIIIMTLIIVVDVIIIVMVSCCHSHYRHQQKKKKRRSRRRREEECQKKRRKKKKQEKEKNKTKMKMDKEHQGFKPFFLEPTLAPMLTARGPASGWAAPHPTHAASPTHPGTCTGLGSRLRGFRIEPLIPNPEPDNKEREVPKSSLSRPALILGAQAHQTQPLHRS